MDRKLLLLITIFAEGGLMVLGLVFMRFSGLDVWSRLDLSWGATALALLLCFPMLAALAFAMRTPWAPLSRLRNELTEKVMPIFANSQLPDLALIALFAGVGEELFFRGWLQSLLTNTFETWIGILIASVVFGLLHALSTTYAVYAALTGFYLGGIYQFSGNLYIVMVIHALYDFIALAYLSGRARKTGSEDSAGS